MAANLAEKDYQKYEREDLRRRLQSRIDDLVSCLHPDAKRTGHEWRLGNIAGGKGESCAIERRGDKAGLWHDHNPAAIQRSGDIFDLIAIRHNLTYAQTLDWAANFLGVARAHFAPQPVKSPVKTAGLDYLVRLEAKLWQHEEALNYLRGRGLNGDTIRRFRLGLQRPYPRKQDDAVVENALSFPIFNRQFAPLARYAYYNIPGVTVNPVNANGWGAGSPLTYWSAPAQDKKTLIIAEGCKDLWLLHQKLAGLPEGEKIVFITSSHGSGIPSEWQDTAFWQHWEGVYCGQDSDDAGDNMARSVVRFCGREVRRLRVPEGLGKDWTDFFQRGGTSEQFFALLREAPAVSEPLPQLEDLWDTEAVGDFAAEPIDINGAYERGYLYYPFRVESRLLERVRGEDGQVSTRKVAVYKTKVVRSDGTVLDITVLPAPRGTSRERRVLALTDGTRIDREPDPSGFATWKLVSIHKFIEARQTGQAVPHRPLVELLSEITAHLQRSVWLPYREDYTLLSLYVALSYVYQIFEAIPLLMVNGEKGTGKSELGQALAAVSFNGHLVGQGSAAAVVRLLNDSRGLLVLDDLEALSKAAADDFSDLNQMLKLSYKKQTSKKTLTLMNGKTATFDFYGPKVINNTQGVDPILGSRMLYIQTRRMPELLKRSGRFVGSDPVELMELRNELHTWGMANVSQVAEIYQRLAGQKTDRVDEIVAPLRTLATLSCDQTVQDTLETALEHQTMRRLDTEDPIEFLKEAVANCIRHGAVAELSSFQISLELRLIADNTGKEWTNQIPVWQRGEWIGQQLRNLEVRDIHAKVLRKRLFGIMSRIYQLRPDFVAEVLEGFKSSETLTAPARQAFDFCTKVECESCPYAGVCADTVSNLMVAKQSRAH